MDCKEAIEYIHSLERFGIMPGLERIGEICRILGNPQEKFRCIHVAGTNGKGSTSTFCANILRSAGLKVGLYTSPYVVDFRERICVDGEMIEPDELALCTQKVKTAAEENGVKLTEFEAVTAVAFIYYEMKQVDVAVLEVGLGGRFDATNIIPAPEVCVITSISLDHTAVLGDTIEKIAFEKSGIIKPGSEVVLYPKLDKRALAVIEEKCRECGIRPVIPPLESLVYCETGVESSRADYMGVKFRLNLPGEHMIYNAITAITAANAFCRRNPPLPYLIPTDIIRKGLRMTSMPARTEILSESPLVIIDGGHNEDCANALKKYIETELAGKRIIAVCSMMEDKDCEAYVSRIAPHASVFIASQAGNPRAMKADKLRDLAAKYCAGCVSVPEPVKACDTALSQAGPDDTVLVCGSFYFAGDVRAHLKEALK